MKFQLHEGDHNKGQFTRHHDNLSFMQVYCMTLDGGVVNETY